MRDFLCVFSVIVQGSPWAELCFRPLGDLGRSYQAGFERPVVFLIIHQCILVIHQCVATVKDQKHKEQ